MPHGVEVFVGLEPIDLRWGIPRLSGIVAERLGRDARSGALFVFFGKPRDPAKVVFPGGDLAALYLGILAPRSTLAPVFGARGPVSTRRTAAAGDAVRATRRRAPRRGRPRS